MVDDAWRFDLPGPKIDVYVTRGNTTLPIAQVPELQPHDKLRVKADLPATQSNRLLLIVAFLRGTTNEPPDNWFTKIETWKQPPEGTLIVVPDGAQRAMLFVAPETGGDFDTLRSAVKGSPGLFIRANMSLNKASLEQQRIERYLAGMQTVTSDDEKVIQTRSAKLAAALALKPDAACFKQPVIDQVDCLTQTSTSLAAGMTGTWPDDQVTLLSTGASGSFFNEAGQADNAVYSAYVGTLIDLIHLVGMLHTAQYRFTFLPLAFRARPNTEPQTECGAIVLQPEVRNRDCVACYPKHAFIASGTGTPRAGLLPCESTGADAANARSSPDVLYSVRSRSHARLWSFC